jgi:hypothetical protein
MYAYIIGLGRILKPLFSSVTRLRLIKDACKIYLQMYFIKFQFEGMIIKLPPRQYSLSGH